MNTVTSKRKYAGCYSITVHDIELELEETNQSCCGRSEPPRWVILYDGVYDVGEFESKRNAMEFLKYHCSKDELIRRINERNI